MKNLVDYLIEKKKEEKKIETNIDIVQQEIDKLVPKEVSQIKEFTPDAIKSLLIRSDQLGGLITIVSSKDKGFLIKFNKEQFLTDKNEITQNIKDIAKYFKEILGAEEVKLNDQEFNMTVK
jgi:hypothetical protein